MVSTITCQKKVVLSCYEAANLFLSGFDGFFYKVAEHDTYVPLRHTSNELESMLSSLTTFFLKWLRRFSLAEHVNTTYLPLLQTNNQC